MRDQPACEIVPRQGDLSGRKPHEHLHLVYSAPDGPHVFTGSIQRGGARSRLANYFLRILNSVFFPRSQQQASNLVLVVDNNNQRAA